VVASVDGPGEVFAAEDGRLRRLTTGGSRWYGPFRRTPERVAVSHPDGHEIDGWLLRAKGSRRPGRLVIDVHGGPHASFGPVPWLEMVALADAGIHVLWTNPRGSAGYGEKFTRTIDGAWGDADGDDLKRVVAWAVKQGLADAGRVGVMGLSYGGFMTTWLLGHVPGLFAAGVSENPVTDMIGEFGSSDFGSIIGTLATGMDRPWDEPAVFLERSPYVQIHRSESPLLLLQSEADLRCPPGQSEIVFTILRSLGRTVEMVRYPDESHILLLNGRPDRRVDRIERIVGWFTRHLGARSSR
jgi:dipeptidyl aminopeptidase/acylaminoacyl peptidase